MQNKIMEIIKAYQKDKDFTGGITDISLLQEAERELNIIIPDQYKWFLETYGSGGVAGVEIYGIYNKELEFVEETKKYRAYGLPNDLIVVENCDEWVNCIDVNSGSIVSWSMFDNVGIVKKYGSFYEYLIDSFQEAIDNL